LPTLLIADANPAVLEAPMRPKPVAELAGIRIGGNLSYSSFLNYVEADQIAAVRFDEQGAGVTFVTQAGDKGRSNVVPDKDLFETLNKHNVDVSIERADLSNAGLANLAPPVIGALILVGLITLFQRNSSVGFGGGANPMTFGKSKAKV
jgi:ATP-dependent Zn protease